MRLTRNKLRRIIISEIRRIRMNEQFGMPDMSNIPGMPDIPDEDPLPDLGDIGIGEGVIEKLKEALKADFLTFAIAAIAAYAMCELEPDECPKDALMLAANAIENSETKKTVLIIIDSMQM